MPDAPDPVMVAYYEGRVAEMEAGYARPAPVWVDVLVAELRRVLRGRHVLEVACGGGHWTALAAGSAASIVAIDASPAMLAAARARGLRPDQVVFRPGNAYDLAEVPGDLDAGLAMQWLSHVPRRRLAAFLDGWHARLGPGAVVFISDNRCNPETPEQHYGKPGHDDTYELRVLPDGTSYEIVKNYFTEDELRSILGTGVTDLAIHLDIRQWWLSYTVAQR
jgi:2-polyprenyl-3-methyl-5-hydroxy-6-metoxy-1,4-benzoquinol methylase